MILDTMLPRQILHIQIQHPTLKKLMKHRVAMETPTLGMLGIARVPGVGGSSGGGMTIPLKTGVEVEIIQMEPADGAPKGTVTTGGSTGGSSEEEAWNISLRAIRRFEIDGEVAKTEEGWTEARVQFLDSAQEEEKEVKQFSKPNSFQSSDASITASSKSDPASIGDRLSVARAISKSKQFTQPNMNMNGSSLVDRWIELARENERIPGQIDTLLKQLGDIPEEHEPTERALWIGALINPLPSLGQAMEIRPQLLVSKKAEERVEVALEAILRSIRHMDGSARMW